MPPTEGNMASFMKEDLSDEWASSPMKLSAEERRSVEVRPETMVGISRQSGRGAGDKKPTQSLAGL